MTLSPSEDRNVKGIEGPIYALNKTCPVPGCGDKATERHHMWRKSDTVGDHWWVHISGGTPIPNCTKLCHFHHQQVTENLARIKWDGENFFWNDPTTGTMLLTDQPLTLEQVEQQNLLAQMQEVAGIEEVPQHTHAGVEPGELCPACHRKVPLPRTKPDPEAPKLRKTWCVAVPEGEWEDGANILGTLLEESRRELGKAGLPYGETDAVKYHVLSTVLALFVQNAHLITSDG